MKKTSYERGFIGLPIIALIVGIIIAGGITYALITQRQESGSSQNEKIENPPPPQSSLPVAGDTVPPNYLPPNITSAIVAKYFYGSNFSGNPKPPADVDERTFVILPKSFFPAEQGAVYQGELYLPNGDGIVIASGFYAKDKNHVYAGGKILPKADPVAFALIEKTPYAKDANHVWADGDLLNNADPAAFTVLDDRWSKDKEHVYFYDANAKPHAVVTDASAATFSIIAGTPFAKDKRHVFRFDGTMLEGPADPATFTVLNEHFAKDKNYVFYHGTIVGSADAETFTIVTASNFFKDKYRLYKSTGNLEQGFVLKTLHPAGFDALSFHNIEHAYFKDKNNVYLESLQDLQRINGADPDTFTLLDLCANIEKSANYYAKDRQYVFCGKDFVAGADPATFEYIGQYTLNPQGLPTSVGIAKDKNCIYRAGGKVLSSLGACAKPASCTTESLEKNPASCGIR